MAVPTTTSNAIQIPQGYPSLRLLTAPMPRKKRYRATMAPMPATASRTLNGPVISFPPTGE